MVVVFAVFVMILLFAGWFIDPASPDPARLYLDVVLTATGYLMLLLALFLSASSLPADIKNKTLHTVVTKPVRAERDRARPHPRFHDRGDRDAAGDGRDQLRVSWSAGCRTPTRSTAADLRPVGQDSRDGKPAGLLAGFTGPTHEHRHQVVIDTATGKGRVEMAQGHWHNVDGRRHGQGRRVYLGPPEGMLQARVPIYGKLRFKTAPGRDAEQGVNVGDEWTYRSFIEGGSQAAAIWTFEGITEAKFPDGLPVEMTIEVFRTYKGDMEQGIPGSLLGPQSEDREEGRSAHFPGQKVRHRRAVHPPRAARRRRAKPVDLFQRHRRRRQAGNLAAMPARAAVFRHGPGRPVPPRPRRLVRA